MTYCPAMSGEIVYGDGDDTLTIDQSFGDPIPSADLLYDGHGGNNRLLVVGGTFDREIDLAIGPRDGNLAFTPGSSISYTNVTSIDDLSTVNDFQFRNATTDFFRVVSIDATATIRSPADQFVPMHFANKTNVTIQEGDNRSSYRSVDRVPEKYRDKVKKLISNAPDAPVHFEFNSDHPGAPGLAGVRTADPYGRSGRDRQVRGPRPINAGSAPAMFFDFARRKFRVWSALPPACTSSGPA